MSGKTPQMLLILCHCCKDQMCGYQRQYEYICVYTVYVYICIYINIYNTSYILCICMHYVHFAFMFVFLA